MIDDIMRDTKQHMAKSVESLRHDLIGIRTGRANPALLEKITVEYYGTATPLNQLALISVPEARILAIKPYDRSVMNAIEKAILKSDLGLTPNNDGQIIRLVLPQLTEERRKEYIKLARHKAEEARIAVRSNRRHAVDSIKKLEKDKEVGEDDARHGEKQLDTLTKKYEEQVNELLKAKEADLLEV